MVQAKTGLEVKKYYNRRYKKEKLAAMRPYEAYLIFLKYLRLKKGKRLLDVGCGTGYFLKAVEKKKVKAFGIDFSPSAIKIANRVAPGAKIFQASVEKLPFKDHFFDYVVSLGCLQYFPHMDKALKEMRRVSKKGAYFCFMVPNLNFIFWKLKGRDRRVLWGIDQNILSLNGWRELLQKEGFRIYEIAKDDWWLQKKPYLKLFWQLIPLNYTYQFIFLCR